MSLIVLVTSIIVLMAIDYKFISKNKISYKALFGIVFVSSGVDMLFLMLSKPVVRTPEQLGGIIGIIIIFIIGFSIWFWKTSKKDEKQDKVNYD